MGGEQPINPETATTSESTLKSVIIKGGAVQDYHKSKGLRKQAKRRYTRKNREDDEMMGGAQDEALVPITHTITKVNETLPGSNPPNATLLQTPAVKAALDNGTVPPIGMKNAPQSLPSNPVVPQTQKAGGNTNLLEGGSKIVLEPKKKTKSGLVLAPPTKMKHKKDKTRKIRVQLSNMKKRITTAKVIHKDSKEKSIGEIRKLLEESKLVKPSNGKKVPEDILRNIYKDYLILRNKAL
jgi:hypothetical protein